MLPRELRLHSRARRKVGKVRNEGRGGSEAAMKRWREEMERMDLAQIERRKIYLAEEKKKANADIRKRIANAELGSVLEPLGKMAARQHATVIANTHLSKATGGNANSRVIGSVAFVNHARAAFIVTADPDDSGKRLFIPSKTNLGKPRKTWVYTYRSRWCIRREHKSESFAPTT